MTSAASVRARRRLHSGAGKDSRSLVRPRGAQSSLCLNFSYQFCIWGHRGLGRGRKPPPHHPARPEPRCPDSWIKALPTTPASLLPASSPLTPPFPAAGLQAASWELALPTHLCLYPCSSSYQSFKTQIESLPSGNLPVHPQSLPSQMGDSYIAGFGLSRPIPSL